MVICGTVQFPQNLKGFNLTDSARIELLKVIPNAAQHPYTRKFIAWGTITDTTNQQYYWISFMNSDYLYQFYVSRPLSKDEIKRISQIKDAYGCNWNYLLPNRYRRNQIDAAASWIDEDKYPQFYSWRYGKSKNKIGIYDLSKVTQYYCNRLAKIVGRVEIKEVVRKYELIGYPLN